MLPVAEFRLTVREHVLTEVEPVFANAGDLLGVITMSSGHYMGYLMSDGGAGYITGQIHSEHHDPRTDMNLGHLQHRTRGIITPTRTVPPDPGDTERRQIDELLSMCRTS